MDDTEVEEKWDDLMDEIREYVHENGLRMDEDILDYFKKLPERLERSCEELVDRKCESAIYGYIRAERDGY